LVVHTWGIGDWLFFTPVLAALQSANPGLQVDVLLGTPSTGNIARLYPVRIAGVCNVRKGMWGFLRLAWRLRRERYDLLLFTAGIDPRKAALAARLFRARQKLWLGRDGQGSYDWSQHGVSNNLKLASRLGLRVPEPALPMLPWPVPAQPAANSVLIHPGSDRVNAYKRWPVERFVAVARALLERGWQVSTVFGPDEIELKAAFEQLEPLGLRQHHGLAFDELLALVAAHACLLNSDSGPGHLAAALGCRVVTVMGPANPVRSRPYTHRSQVVLAPNPPACMPCIRPGGRYGCAERPCLVGVSPEAVLEAVLQPQAGVSSAAG
jgi:ADP-heptose:LPS heptosyltransferase